MTVPVAATVPVGWYADPMGTDQLRWWDGSAWTADLIEKAPAASHTPTAGVADVADSAEGADVAVISDVAEIVSPLPVTRRQLREISGPLTTVPMVTGMAIDLAANATAHAATLHPGHSAATPHPAPPTPLDGTSDQDSPFDASSVESSAPAATRHSPLKASLGFVLPPDPFALPRDAPALRVSSPIIVADAIPTAAPAVRLLATDERSTTLAVWALALVPALQAAVAWLLIGQAHVVVALPLQIGLLAAPLVLSLPLASTDRRMLRDRGFDRVPPAALAVVPPLYLIVRAVRVGSAGIVPLFVWLLSQAAAISFLLLQVPAAFAFPPAGAPQTVSATVSASGPITAAQRATELTPAGMAAALTAQSLARNLHFESISCPPLPSTLDGTAVTCVGTVALVKVNLNVVVDSSLQNSAFALLSEAPAG